MKRALLALVIVLVSTSMAMAVAFPTLAVKPSYLAPAVSLTQTSSLITLDALSEDVPYAAATGAVPSPYTNDYTLKATLSFNEDNLTELGLVARANTSTLSMYEASSNPVNHYLALVKITNGTGFTNLDTYEFADFDVSKSYVLKLRANGSSLSASMYDGATEITTIGATDSDFTSGEMGIFTFKPTGGGTLLSGQWANPSVYMVPEPGTVGMLIAGTLALLGWAGLRRR